MNNQKLFQETFSQVQMREECLHKIEILSQKEDTKMKKRKWRYATACVAIFAVIVLSGNGICYAMTGNNLVQEVVKRYVDMNKKHVLINNDIEEICVSRKVEEDGSIWYEVPNIDGDDTWGLRVEEPEHTSIFGYSIPEVSGKSGIIWFEGEIIEKDGRIFLNITNLEDSVDITEDFTDGVVNGTFEYTFNEVFHETFAYQVKGTVEDYTIEVEWIKKE